MAVALISTFFSVFFSIFSFLSFSTITVAGATAVVGVFFSNGLVGNVLAGGVLTATLSSSAEPAPPLRRETLPFPLPEEGEEIVCAEGVGLYRKR